MTPKLHSCSYFFICLLSFLSAFGVNISSAQTGAIAGGGNAGSYSPGAANALVYSFSLDQSVGAIQARGFSFTTTAGDASTVSSYYAYLATSAGNTLTTVPADAFLLGSVVNVGPGLQTIPTWNNNSNYYDISTGTTYYIYITANILNTATVGSAISVSAPTTANFIWNTTETEGTNTSTDGSISVIAGSGTQLFSYTGGPTTAGGGVQTYVVPAGITKLSVQVAGARGGTGGYTSSKSHGGNGGLVSATLNVTPLSTLYVYVGNVGNSCIYTGTAASGPGGSNSGGGANGGSGSNFEGGGGGGASDIRTAIGPANLDTRCVIGGGGGGGSAPFVATINQNIGGIGGYNGGAGGGLGLFNGAWVSANCGNPGTYVCCAIAGNGGTAGALGAGGNCQTFNDGGGGGGGYYGGSGAENGGACGGSSYAVDVAGVTVGNITYADGDNNGAGYVMITPIIVPVFVNGATTSLTLCQEATATDIIPLLHVSDADVAQTETWSEQLAPTHGTLTITSATAGSGSADITPGGTITYQPATGFSGSDAFTIRVSDGADFSDIVVNVTVIPTPVVNPISDQTVCNTTSTASVNFTGNATSYTWNNNNSSIGLASSGTGDIAVFTATNSASAVSSATVSVTPNIGSCVGAPQAFSINVNPTPNVVNPGDQTVCNGNSTTLITFTGAVSGTVYTWTNSDASIALATTGTGDIAAFTAINSSSVVVTSTVTVTPSANACTGSSQSFTLTINPTPDVVVPPNQVLCNGTSTTLASFTGAVSGTIFTWTNNNVSIGLGGLGTGDINPFTATNVTSGIQTATITVTPAANTCLGTPHTFMYTVNPTPDVILPGNQVVCNGTTTTLVSFSSSVTGTTYTWTNSDPTIGLANTGSVNIAPFTAINGTTAIETATVTVTPTANTCVGNAQNYLFTINPTPVLTSILSVPAICDSVIFNYTPGSLTTGTTFNWSRAAVSGIFTPSAIGTNNPNEVLYNNTNIPVVVTYIYTLTANGCPNVQNVTTTVNPNPSLSSSLAPPALCSGSLLSYTPTSAVAVATFNWSRASVLGISNFSNSGTNNPNEVLNNTVATAKTVNYVYIMHAYGCADTQNVAVVVQPKPIITSALSDTVCSGANFNYSPTGPIAGTTYTWVRAAVADISPVTGNSSGSLGTINETLTSATLVRHNVIYAYTLTANGCPYNQNFILTIDPAAPVPSITTRGPSTVCSNTQYVNFGASVAAPDSVQYTWSAAGATIFAQGAGHRYSLVSFPTSGNAQVILTSHVSGITCLSADTFAVTVSNSTSVNTEIFYVHGRFIYTDNTVDSYQWGYDDVSTLDSTIYSGQVEQTFFLTTPDFDHNKYWVMTIKGGCMAKTYYNAPTGVKEVNTAAAITLQVYPNPADQSATVTIEGISGGTTMVQLTDITGKTITEQTAQNNKATIDVSALAPGMYIISCYHNGLKAGTAKLIKN